MTSSSKSIGELFDSFEREAFRLETLDDYGRSGSVDAYQKFLAGEPEPLDYNAKWVAELRSHTSKGKRIYRVHILSRPLSPYPQFELGWGYVKNMTGGEEFYILDTTDRQNPLIGVGDFWLFDETTPLLLHYDEYGAVTELETPSVDQAQEFLNYRDTALALAEPFPKWWAEHGQ